MTTTIEHTSDLYATEFSDEVLADIHTLDAVAHALHPSSTNKGDALQLAVDLADEAKLAGVYGHDDSSVGIVALAAKGFAYRRAEDRKQTPEMTAEMLSKFFVDKLKNVSMMHKFKSREAIHGALFDSNNEYVETVFQLLLDEHEARASRMKQIALGLGTAATIVAVGWKKLRKQQLFTTDW